jgi:hypothetical protein
MATVIKIKTSNLDKAPVDGNGDSVLATGELAYSYYTGATTNNGDRIYIGTGTETNGLSADYAVIGGKYFTDMLDHTHGTLTASSGIIVDSNKKIDELRIDNLQIGVYDTNTISVDQTSDANGDIKLIPGGTGDVVITATNLEVNAAMAYTGNTTFTGNVTITGSGVGNLEVDGESTLASAIVEDLTNNRIVLAGTGGAIEDDANFTFDGTTFQINATPKFTVDVNTGNTKAYGTFEVDGQSTLASAKVEDLTNNRIVLAGTGGELEDDVNFTFDGTTLSIGTGNFTVAQATGNTYALGTLTVDGNVNFNSTGGTGTAADVTVDGQLRAASLNVDDLTVTRVVFVGANGELVDDGNFTFDSSTDKLDITGSLEVDNIGLDANTISTTTGALTIQPAANAETIINTTSAFRVPVGNSTERPTAATGQIRYNTTTSQYEGYSSGAWQGLGGVIDVDQNTYIIAQPTSNLPVPATQNADTLYFVTGGQLQAQMDTATGMTVNNINVNDNTISTTTGDLYLDPGQTGAGSPTGDVVIYGNLNVMGTTTTIDSTTVTIDDPVFTLGGDTNPSTDDNKDRGIEFKWHDGTNAKVGFFGWDDSASRFKFIADATNTAEVFAGAASDVEFGNALIDSLTFSATNFTQNSVPWIDTNGDLGFLDDDGTSPYGPEGQVIQMDATGVPFFGHIDCGTY